MIEKQKRGRPKGRGEKPYLEKKVMVYYTVKRKHHAEAMAAIRELCKQWR